MLEVDGVKIKKGHVQVTEDKEQNTAIAEALTKATAEFQPATVEGSFISAPSVVSTPVSCVKEESSSEASDGKNVGDVSSKIFGPTGISGLVFTPLPTDSDTESELETINKPSLNIDSAMPTPVRITLDYETEVDGVSVIPSCNANEVINNTLSHMRALFG